MADHKAGQTEIPDGWVQQFRSNVDANLTARKAWDDLDRAGLDAGTLFLLWGYAGGPLSDISQMHRRTEYASGRMKSATRARKVATSGTHKRAQNPGLFHDRASERLQDALRADWPVPTAKVRTVEDELALASKVKGREIPFDAAQKAIVKAAGDRSPMNPMFFLMLLQGCAAKHGVTLGLKRLKALADCAAPDKYKDGLDEGTLGRYIGSYPLSMKAAILRDALPTLPPVGHS